MKDENGVSRGFGFVCFKDMADAAKALDSFNDQSQEENSGKLYVREAKSKEQRQLELAKKTYQFKKSMMMLNLVVKNVDESTTEEELVQLYEGYGTVKNVKWIPEAKTAFVCYNDREGARSGKENTSQMQFKGRTLFVTYCEPKESRRAHLEEMADKRAYEKCRMKASSSANSDVMTLLQTLGLLMSSMNQN